MTIKESIQNVLYKWGYQPANYHSTTSNAILYFHNFHSRLVSPLYIPSILFKKDSFPVEFVLYAEAPWKSVAFPTSMNV